MNTKDSKTAMMRHIRPHYSRERWRTRERAEDVISVAATRNPLKDTVAISGTQAKMHIGLHHLCEHFFFAQPIVIGYMGALACTAHDYIRVIDRKTCPCYTHGGD